MLSTDTNTDTQVFAKVSAVIETIGGETVVCFTLKPGQEAQVKQLKEFMAGLVDCLVIVRPIR